MWRNIIVQASYQIVVVLCLLYFGTFLFVEEEYNLVTTTLRDEEGRPTGKMQMDTMIFYCYIMMNMANQINCRVVDENEFLPIRLNSLCSNFIFWVVFIAEMILTHLMLMLGKTHFGNAVLGVTTMTWLQYSICWTFALLSFAVFILSKKVIPLQPFRNLMLRFDLEMEDPNATAALGWINKLFNMCLKNDDEEQEEGRGRTSEIEQLDRDEDDGISRGYSQFAHDKQDQLQTNLI